MKEITKRLKKIKNRKKIFSNHDDEVQETKEIKNDEKEINQKKFKKS